MGLGKWLKRGLMVAGGFVTGGSTWGMLAADIAGDVIGGIAQSRAAGKAEEQLRRGGRAAQAYHEPYYQAGTAQLGTLGELAGITGEDIHKRTMMDPSFDFRMREGLKARDQTAAARGTLLTGGHIKGTERYAQELASTEYGRAYDRASSAIDSQYNRSARLAGAGQTAAGAMGGLEGDIATAEADASIAKGDVWARTAGRVSDTIGGMIAQRSERQRASSYGGGSNANVPLTSTPVSGRSRPPAEPVWI